MALRYTSGFASSKSVIYDVEIYDADFSGAATDFLLGPDGFSLAWRGDENDRHAPVLGSEVGFDFYVQDAGLEQFITDLGTSREGRFTVRITKGAVPVLFWAGVLLCDAARLEDAGYPYVFRVTASDGLGALKDVDYADGLNAYTGDATFVQHVLNCLGKIPSVTEHFASGTGLLRTAVDWWSVQAPGSPGASVDPLNIHGVNHSVFYDFDKGQKRYKSCLEVLETICRAFGARLVFFEGTYWVMQISVQTAAFRARAYDLGGNYLSQAIYSGGMLVDGSASGALLDGASRKWLAPLQKATVEYTVSNRRNWFSGTIFSDTFTTSTAAEPVKTSGGNTTLRLSGQLSAAFTALETIPTGQYFVEFGIVIQVGSNVVSRPFSVVNFSVSYGWLSWGAAPAYAAFVCGLGLSSPAAAGNVFSFSQSLDFTTPPMPGDGELTFGMTVRSVRRSDGTVLPATAYEIKFSLENHWLEVYSYGNPTINEDSNLYTALNAVAGNTETLDAEVLIGDGTLENSRGRIKYFNGTTWADTTFWGAGTGTRNKQLLQLLANTMVGGQLTPTLVLYATIFGTFTFWKGYSVGGVYYLLMSATFTANLDELGGAFFELKYGTGYNETTPVKIVKILPATGINPGTAGGGLTTNGIPQKTGNPTTVLGPLAQAFSSAPLFAGKLANLPVSSPLAGGAVAVGDSLTIIDPVSGAVSTVTVTKSPAAGATSIQVDGTLTAGFSPGAYIVKTGTGAWSLPASAQPPATSPEDSRWWLLWAQLFRADATLPAPWEMELDTEIETARNAGDGTTAGIRLNENGLLAYDATSATARTALSPLSGLLTAWAYIFQNYTGSANTTNGRMEFHQWVGDTYAHLSYANGTYRFPLFGHTLLFQAFGFAENWATGDTKAFFTVGARYAGLKIARIFITVRSVGTSAVLLIQKSGATQVTQNITAGDHTVTINQTLSSGDIWHFNVSNAGSPAAKGLNIEIELAR